jgi:hypothetical protein
MHLRFGFDSFKVDFTLESEETEFRIVKLKDVEADRTADEFRKYATIDSSKFLTNAETG